MWYTSARRKREAWSFNIMIGGFVKYFCLLPDFKKRFLIRCFISLHRSLTYNCAHGCGQRIQVNHRTNLGDNSIVLIWPDGGACVREDVMMITLPSEIFARSSGANDSISLSFLRIQYGKLVLLNSAPQQVILRAHRHR